MCSFCAILYKIKVHALCSLVAVCDRMIIEYCVCVCVCVCVCARALVASVVRLVKVETCMRNLGECAVCWIK